MVKTSFGRYVGYTNILSMHQLDLIVRKKYRKAIVEDLYQFFFTTSWILRSQRVALHIRIGQIHVLNTHCTDYRVQMILASINRKFIFEQNKYCFIIYLPYVYSQRLSGTTQIIEWIIYTNTDQKEARIDFKSRLKAVRY